MKTLLRIAVVFALALGTRTAAASPIVLNGGFETGTFTDWVASPGAISEFGVNADSARSGSFSAYFGGVNSGGGNEDTISQSFATAAGQSYVVDFWLSRDVIPGCERLGVCADNDFSAYWNGAPILFLQSVAAFDYTAYTFLLPATAATSTISFAGASQFGYYRLDDVSVTAVPEPASLALLGAGLTVWLAARYRRRRDG